jgi:hypothetical protein
LCDVVVVGGGVFVCVCVCVEGGGGARRQHTPPAVGARCLPVHACMRACMSTPAAPLPRRRPRTRTAAPPATNATAQ